MASQQPSLQPDPETVDSLLSATVRVVEDERSRGGTADTKAGQLVGFTGVILAIDVAFGRNVIAQGISNVYEDVFIAFFVISLVALVAGAFIAIRGALLPQRTLAFRRGDVERLADGDLVLADPVEMKRTLIRTYGKELVAEEQRNDRKLDVIKRAALLLMAGVLALTCEGAILAVDHIAMGGRADPSHQTSSPAPPSGAERPKPPASLPLGASTKSLPESPGTQKRR